MDARAEAQQPVDRYWSWMFVATFFAIHVGRMQAEWNLVSLLSPAVAVLGDVAFSLILAYGLMAPLRAGWRFVTRPFERRAWQRYLQNVDEGRPPGMLARLSRWWLTGRMSDALRVTKAKGSPTAAVGWGLRVGVPLTAILIAINPIWGISWYFNTENWVTGAWEWWVEQRVDDWRTAMVRGIGEQYRGSGISDAEFFRVRPQGLGGETDFSFIVIGDTGEGDPSQHVLRDQFLRLGQQPEVRFLIVSSDVIYPQGAMKDYEPKFYLPFKGFEKPIYAVPGNHDWYDALEAFAANFFEPAAARAALRARRFADHDLTTTTETRIDGLIQNAARLREAYGLRAGEQRAPYFEIQTDRFALIVVDTGILRRIDADQKAWLKDALERSRGKFTMAILGHPLFAGGHYQGSQDPSFADVHRLLRDYNVRVVMGGDTHDFEYYEEFYQSVNSDSPPVAAGQVSQSSPLAPRGVSRSGYKAKLADGGDALFGFHHAERDGYDGQEPQPTRRMLHFVNGGGGAYLSIGSALNWPLRQPLVTNWAHYPRRDAMIQKLDAETPLWKWPMWFWVKQFNAWPSYPEAMASAFDYNRAPFYQSFVEVKVEGSRNRVRFLVYGANGPLQWSDLELSSGPASRSGPVEWVVEMGP